MDNKLTFYIDRESFLHSLNPLTKITLVFAFIIIAFTSPWFWLPALLIVLAILPLSFVGRIQGEFLQSAKNLLLPVVGFLFVMQSLFHPDSSRILLEIWFLDISLGSLQHAF